MAETILSIMFHLISQIKTAKQNLCLNLICNIDSLCPFKKAGQSYDNNLTPNFHCSDR